MEENGNKYEEAMSKIASLENEATKWKATAKTMGRVEHPKVLNATVAFAEATRSNHKLQSKVDDVFAM